MRLLLLSSLLVLPLLPGCIAAAGVGAGALVATEYLSDTPHVAHLQLDVDQVWSETVDALHDMGATKLEVQNYPRIAQGLVYEGEVYVKVVVTSETSREELRDVCERVAGIDAAVPLILQPVTPVGKIDERPGAKLMLSLLRRAETMLRDVRVIPQTHRAYDAL